MRISRSLLIAALTASATCVAGAAHAHAAVAAAARPQAVSVPPAFSDGSFESPSAPAGWFATYAAGQSFGPWTVTSGSIDLIGAGYWAASDGDQSVDLSGNSAGTIAQTFATTPGTLYTVSYALAGNPDGGPAVKTGQVLLDGQDVQDFTFDVTGKTHTDMGYVTERFTFLATKPSSTLSFVSTTASANGPVLDNVQVIASDCCKQACG